MEEDNVQQEQNTGAGSSTGLSIDNRVEIAKNQVEIAHNKGDIEQNKNRLEEISNDFKVLKRVVWLFAILVIVFFIMIFINGMMVHRETGLNEYQNQVFDGSGPGQILD